MKEHRSNKFYNIRLTRWIDRLLPFAFNIEQNTRRKKGAGRLHFSPTESKSKSYKKI